ncbi:isovaleryl-CoA dehydrogenase [Apiospora arundinis]
MASPMARTLTALLLTLAPLSAIAMPQVATSMHPPTSTTTSCSTFTSTVTIPYGSASSPAVVTAGAINVAADMMGMPVVLGVAAVAAAAMAH